MHLCCWHLKQNVKLQTKIPWFRNRLIHFPLFHNLFQVAKWFHISFQAFFMKCGFRVTESSSKVHTSVPWNKLHINYNNPCHFSFKTFCAMFHLNWYVIVAHHFSFALLQKLVLYIFSHNGVKIMRLRSSGKTIRNTFLSACGHRYFNRD